MTKGIYSMFDIALAKLRRGKFDKAKELYVFFWNVCKEKDYKPTGCAQTDWRELIKKNILAIQASGILKDVFEEEP